MMVTSYQSSTPRARRPGRLPGSSQYMPLCTILESPTRTTPRNGAWSHARVVDGHGRGSAASLVPYEDFSFATSTESFDSSIAFGAASSEELILESDASDMEDNAVGRLDWPLPPTSKFNINSPGQANRMADDSSHWPLPARGHREGQSANSPPRARRFHPNSAASLMALVSTPQWPLPNPAPRISFDERRRVTEPVSPPLSPVWPLPPTVKSFDDIQRATRSASQSTASPISSRSYDRGGSWDCSERSEVTTETAPTSIDEESLDEDDENDATMCVVSPDDWFARFYPDTDLSNTATDDCPDLATLAAVQHLPIFDSHGIPRPFGSLYDPSKTTHQRQLIIFIRHFYCGACQAYLQALAEAISMRESLSIPIPTDIIVIGCGQYNLIDYYKKFTKCPFPIFAEPSRKLFKKLGMTVTANIGWQTPGYMKGVSTVPWLATQVRNIHNGLWNDPENGIKPKDVFRGGNIMQIGGEFLFEDGQVLWCHRMKNFRNHAEVTVLRKLLELDESDQAEQGT